MRLTIALISCLIVAIELSTSCTPPEFKFSPPPPESSCFDQELNGLEGDTDCGGDCALCEVGRGCNQDADCELGSCVGRRCQASHCVDESLGGSETDVDCGGSECLKCGVSQRCTQSLDCRSNACMGGECVATGCDDAEMGGAETDLDCGGGTCPGCEKGKRCTSGGDCKSGICLDEVCSTEACADGKQGANEAGVDCGGTCPKVCGPISCLEDPLGCDPPITGGNGGRNGQGGSNAAGSGGSAGEIDGGTGGTVTGEGGSSAGGSSTTGGSATGGNPGGASGAGGAGGSLSGSAGATSGGAAAGGAGTGGSSPLESCTGCARLSVPLAAPLDKANYVIVLPAVMDFRNAVITYRVFKRAGTGGEIRGYVQHSGSPDFGQLFQSRPLRLSACDGWEEIVWNVADEGGNYDKSIVGRVGIHVIGVGSTEWTNPTVLYLDSISVAGPSVGPWDFAEAASINPTATYGAEPNLLWRNLGDDPVEGSDISWLGP